MHKEFGAERERAGILNYDGYQGNILKEWDAVA
jgi:hypothetical protein